MRGGGRLVMTLSPRERALWPVVWVGGRSVSWDLLALLAAALGDIHLVVGGVCAPDIELSEQGLAFSRLYRELFRIF